MSQYILRTKRNIPEGTVALEEGAAIIDSTGEQIGEIERVIADPRTDRATHLLVSEGLILKDHKLVPTDWITNVLEDAVHLSVKSELVDDLPVFQSA